MADDCTIKVKGFFRLEEEVFASKEQIELLKAGDSATVQEFKHIIGSCAQETVQWGDTPFEVTECEISTLIGLGFEPKEKG